MNFVFYVAQCDQGIKNLSAEKAHQLSADDPDYSIRDLYNSIAKGTPPSWTLKIQVMTFEQAEKFRWNPFDLTKVNIFAICLIFFQAFLFIHSFFF